MRKPTVSTEASAKPVTVATPAPSKGLPAVKVEQQAPPQGVDNSAPLLALLKVEAAARDAADDRDLVLLMANETRKLTRARQILVLRPALSGAMEVCGISSIPIVEKNSPLVILMEEAVARAARKAPLDVSQLMALPSDKSGSGGNSYPFPSLHWVPLRHGAGALEGGLLLAREEPWSEQDLVIATRLAAAYAHAFRALGSGRRFRKLSVSRLQALIAAAVAAAALLLIKVPLKALAPVEIAARDPFIVAAPIDGVIEEIAVDPNQPVKSGTLVVKLADTVLKNRFEVAERDVQVAEARLKQANQVAFSDQRGMHEIGIARAELSLKIAERDFARDMLEKTQLRAARDGIAIYSDKRELLGKPVAVGERILEIAEAAQIEARIELPVADAIALTSGARVKLFLDSDPLLPWSAEVRRADYKARTGENDIVSFRVVAAIAEEAGRPLPRLGVRGTAQVSGDEVPLGLYLFRRPITFMRQWIGI